MNTNNLHNVDISFESQSYNKYQTNTKSKKCDKYHISLDNDKNIITKTDINIYMNILKFFLKENYNKCIEKECKEINKLINKDIDIIVKQHNISRIKFIYFLLNDYNYWIDNIINNNDIDSYMFIFTYNILTYYHKYINLLKKILK